MPQWTPQAKTKLILDRAWEHISSVSYSVSLRWLFYRLLQDAIYHNKADYKWLTSLTAKARKSFYGEWHPAVLSDDTRRSNIRGAGHRPDFSVASEIVELADYLDFTISHFHNQDYYVELWFEAKAMSAQFEHYTRDITLRPFGGDPSIPFKYEIARQLSAIDREYGKPIIVLYFGDLDDKGLQIPRSAERDIRQWSAVDFEFHHCGLSSEQVEKYGIPEDPDRPGKYQWEALTDEQACEIITGAVAEWIDDDIIDETNDSASALVEKWQARVREVLEELVAGEVD